MLNVLMLVFACDWSNWHQYEQIGQPEARGSIGCGAYGGGKSTVNGERRKGKVKGKSGSEGGDSPASAASGGRIGSSGANREVSAL